MTASLPTSSSSFSGRQLPFRTTTPEQGQKSGFLPRPDKARLSLVVPVYNEAETIGVFLDAIGPVLAPLNVETEIVFINDGSKDGTLAVLLDAAAKNKSIRIVNLSRNFGKEAATTAGLDMAMGDVVIPMDVDLQDPPELIGEFLTHWRAGFDIVYGIRQKRDGDGWAKQFTAGAYYRLFNKIAALPIPENAGDFRLMDRRVVEALKAMPERTRFNKGLFSWPGFSSKAVPFLRPERSAGTTKYNWPRMMSYALDGLTSFTAIPLKIWSLVGVIIAALAFAHGAYVIINTLIFGVQTPGYASLVTIMLFLGGVQLITLGVMGEYIARMYTEMKGRPLYLIDTLYQQEQPPFEYERRQDQDAKNGA